MASCILVLLIEEHGVAELKAHGHTTLNEEADTGSADISG
jgi:hypothetical protein